jgi:hypothetical protein
VILVYSSAQLVNNTIVGNSTWSMGGGAAGGIYSYDGSPVVRNCIVWGNTCDNVPAQIALASGTLAVTYSCVQGGWTGTGNLDADPLFADPQRATSSPERLRCWNGSA